MILKVNLEERIPFAPLAVFTLSLEGLCERSFQGSRNGHPLRQRCQSEEGEAETEKEHDRGDDGFGGQAGEAGVEMAGQPDGQERSAGIPRRPLVPQLVALFTALMLTFLVKLIEEYRLASFRAVRQREMSSGV